MTNPETARTKDTTRTTITAREVVDIEFDRDDDISVGNTVGVEVGTAVGSGVGTQSRREASKYFPLPDTELQHCGW